MISAKTGLGVDTVLEAIVNKLPPPKEGDASAPLKAMLVDSWYDAYLGVIVLVARHRRVLKKGQAIRMMGTDAKYPVDRVRRQSRPRWSSPTSSAPGEIGSSPPRSKKVADTRVGDTITEDKRPNPQHAAGLQAGPAGGLLRPLPRRCRRFRGPARRHGQAAPQRRRVLLRNGNLGGAGFGVPLRLPRPAASRNHPERLEREFDLDLIATAPSVVYQLYLTDGSIMELHNPADMPDVVRIDHIEEPWIRATILTPDEHLGAILKLCQERRGIQIDLSYVGSRAMLGATIWPLNDGGVRFLRTG